MKFSAPDAPRTLATFDTPGLYELELRASDSALDARARVRVNVAAGD